MPSQNKTATGLSQFVENDNIEMSDYNHDMQVIESRIGCINLRGNGNKFLCDTGEYKDVYTVNDYYADATYNNGFYYLDVKNNLNKLVPPYTVNFVAPTNAKAGDKIYINGVEHVVNLYGKGFDNDASDFTTFMATKIGNGYTTFEQLASPTYINVNSKKDARARLKPNTTYTLISDIKTNSITAGNFFLTQGTSTVDCFNETTTISGASGVGIKKFKVTTKTDLTNTQSIRMFLHNTAMGLITLRVMLLEGDWTNRDIPATYWENTFGEYPILSYSTNQPITDNAFVQNQLVTLNIGMSGAIISPSTQRYADQQALLDALLVKILEG